MRKKLRSSNVLIPLHKVQSNSNPSTQNTNYNER